MSGSTGRESNGCARVRELVPWYPTGTLGEGERARVESHVSQCETCASLLEFSAGVKEMMLEVEALHPPPDALVDFVEGAAEDRGSIEAHVAACASCREQVQIIEHVDRADDGAAGTRPTRTWARLIRGVLGPAPAAVYLVVAVVAVGLWLRPPGDGTIPGNAIAPAGRVVVVADERDPVRRGVREDERRVVLDGSAAHLLLLELTTLENPPADDDVYTVAFETLAGAGPIRETAVAGADFRDNYTIAFTLAPGALEEGDYTVTVTSPEGATVFQSALTIHQ
jgi:hypothetical protein